MAIKITSTDKATTFVKIESGEATTFVKKITVGTPIRGVVGATVNIENLAGVTISNAQPGQFLIYDSSSSNWLNTSLTDGTGISTTYDDAGDTFTIASTKHPISLNYDNSNGTVTLGLADGV